MLWRTSSSHWTGGDVYPFIRIGRRLLRRGHTVTVVTHAYYKPPVRQVGLAFAPIDTLDDSASNAKTPRSAIAPGGLWLW